MPLLAAIALALLGTPLALPLEAAAILALARITTLGGGSGLASASLRRSACVALVAEFVATTAMKILAAIAAVLLAPFALVRLRACFAALRVIVTAMALTFVSRPALLMSAARPPHLDQLRHGSSLRGRYRRLRSRRLRSRRLRSSSIGRYRRFGRHSRRRFRLSRCGVG